MFKSAKAKEMGHTDEARPLGHSALGYQSPLERLVAGVCVKR